MERDPKTGRFLPGNRVAIGNKGNGKSKWKNRNAVKHGYYGIYRRCWIEDSGRLVIEMGREGRTINIITLPQGGFEVLDDGSINLNDYFTSVFAKSGIQLLLCSQ